MSEKKTIQLELPAWVLCDVVLGPPDADGFNATIFKITPVHRGNFGAQIEVHEDFEEEIYVRIDELAAEAFKEDE